MSIYPSLAKDFPSDEKILDYVSDNLHEQPFILSGTGNRTESFQDLFNVKAAFS